MLKWLKIEGVAEPAMVGTHGLCVRKASIDYQCIIGRTDRASLHCQPNFHSFATPSKYQRKAENMNQTIPDILRECLNSDTLLFVTQNRGRLQP